MKNYDAVVIGSGQAGTPLVFKYASKKKNVALIEKQHLGGTCLNVGCTPTKAYVASAKRAFDVLNADNLGIEVPSGTKANLSKIKVRKDALIEKSVKGLSSAIDNNKYIDYYQGSAEFVDNYTLKVNGEIIKAEKIFINVGGRSRIPDEFKKVNYLTNEGILDLTEVPEHLIIIGGSYIGLEFGQIFNRLGSKVTIIERNSRLIKKEDEDVSETIKEIFEKEGIEFKLNSSCLGADKDSDGKISVNINCDTGKNTVKGSHLLLAVGRTSNADVLNLKATDINVNNRGFIEVNDKLETNVKNIYALGDCNGKGAFTHTAYNDYEIISANIFYDGNRKVSDRIMTYGLFIDPPLGRAGMTLAQAKESGKNIKAAEYRMSDVARAKEKGETDGFMRIVIDADTDRILGASILGIGGDEIISSILNIMYADKPYTLIRDSVQVHPTVSELIPTMLQKSKKI